MTARPARRRPLPTCPLCHSSTDTISAAEASWLPPAVVERLEAEHTAWHREDGACAACLQRALLGVLFEHGNGAHPTVQSVWPIDARAAFGVLPTPLRLNADHTVTGRGATLALVDAGFYPHSDLVAGRNRIRAWLDASKEPVLGLRFEPDERPQWPGWDKARPAQWHGLMTSAVAAGDGALSHGLYRGLASEADVVLVQVRDGRGRITNASIARALRWLAEFGPGLGVRVVNLSVGGDPVQRLAGNPVDEAVADLVDLGIVVVAAAGNDGRRRLVPPATAPAALTIGGLDDHNNFDPEQLALWHSNYGRAVDGARKPELVAPSMWVVAPVLPGTRVAREATALFARRARGDNTAESRIAEHKLVTPYYQHVEGTSFAAPVVASIVACMLEADRSLTPARIREILLAAAQPVPGARAERQGAGAIDAGRAVALVKAQVAEPRRG